MMHLDEAAASSTTPVSFFFYCNMFIRACPFLGILFALFTILSGAAWESYEGYFCVSRSDAEADSCSHCQEIEHSRIRMERADAQVQRAQLAKQQFMAYVFHNIRVPFNAIVLGLGHMQAPGDGAGAPIGDVTDKMDLVQMMLDCVETMTSVLDDVTDMGNFLSNAVKFTPAGGKLDLKVHCEGVVENKHTGLSLLAADMSSSSTEPITRTVCDPLLGATGTSILTKTSSQPKHVVNKVARLRISVSDDGIGISAEDQAKLFEPYSFVTSGWVQKGGVSGLGLSMAKRFVEQVGGSIGVESSVGKGSMFFFSIPFPLVARNGNINKTDSVLVSNYSEAFQNESESSEFTSRTYDLSAAPKSVPRRRKSMEQEVKSVQIMGPATKPADNKQEDNGLDKGRHCSSKALV